jgi:hypothetical protein
LQQRGPREPLGASLSCPRRCRACDADAVVQAPSCPSSPDRSLPCRPCSPAPPPRTSSNFARLRVASTCFGPSAVAVMKGRLIEVWVRLDSSILAFSAASDSRCSAWRSLRRSMPGGVGWGGGMGGGAVAGVGLACPLAAGGGALQAVDAPVLQPAGRAPLPAARPHHAANRPHPNPSPIPPAPSQTPLTLVGHGLIDQPVHPCAPPFPPPTPNSPQPQAAPATPLTLVGHEPVRQPVHHALVEVVAAQVGVAAGGQHLKHAVADLQHAAGAGAKGARGCKKRRGRKVSSSPAAGFGERPAERRC